MLSGGQYTLATVFRAGLPTGTNPHRWPIPDFRLDETVNIWWGQSDLLSHNTTRQGLHLDWTLSPQGIKISIRS
jgi:hypothetical protein